MPLRRLLNRLRRDERGQSMVLFAIALPVIILFIGFGIDLARMHVVRTDLQAALDAAALAGAQGVQLNITQQKTTVCDQYGTDPVTGQQICVKSHTVTTVYETLSMNPATVQANAQKVFDANVAETDGGNAVYTPSNFQVQTSQSSCYVTVSAQATVNTVLMDVIGANKVDLSGQSAAAQPSASGVACQ